MRHLSWVEYPRIESPFVFVYLYLCICICVLVFVYLHFLFMFTHDYHKPGQDILCPTMPTRDLLAFLTLFFLSSVGGGQQAPVLYRISSLSANAVLTAYRQVFPCVTNDNCTHFSINTFRNCQIFGPALTIVGFFIFAKPRIIKVLTPRVT